MHGQGILTGGLPACDVETRPRIVTARGNVAQDTLVRVCETQPGLTRAQNTGRVFVADIGMPVGLFLADRTAIEAIYRAGDLVELVKPDLA